MNWAENNILTAPVYYIRINLLWLQNRWGVSDYSLFLRRSSYFLHSGSNDSPSDLPMSIELTTNMHEDETVCACWHSRGIETNLKRCLLNIMLQKTLHTLTCIAKIQTKELVLLVQTGGGHLSD